MPDTFWLHIAGEPGDIDAAALYKGTQAILHVLRATGVDDFVVSDLRLASLDIGFQVRIPGDWRAEFDRIVGQVESLDQGRVPDDVGADVLDGLVELQPVRGLKGVGGISIGAQQDRMHEVGEAAFDTAKEALTYTTLSLGSVKGRIHRFFDRNGKREVSLVDQSSGRSVRVQFAKDAERRITEGVNREVLAWGELRRDRFGRKVSLRLDDFEVLDSVDPGDSGAGLLGPDWTGDTDSVTAVRGQRA